MNLFLYVTVLRFKDILINFLKDILLWVVVTVRHSTQILPLNPKKSIPVQFQIQYLWQLLVTYPSFILGSIPNSIVISPRSIPTYFLTSISIANYIYIPSATSSIPQSISIPVP